MYTEAFKEAMVVKMMMPGGLSSKELMNESGISQASLFRWKKAYGKFSEMPKDRDKKRPKDWSAEERLRALLDTSKLGEEELGIYLRREGIHSFKLEQWTKEFLEGQKSLLSKPGKRRGNSEEKKKIKELERDLRRKDRALAEVTALLVLKKKADLIWGVVEDEESM